MTTTKNETPTPVEHIFSREVQIWPKGGSVSISGKFCGKVVVDEWSKDLRLFKIDMGNGAYAYISPADVSYIVVSEFGRVSIEDIKDQQPLCQH